MTSNDIIETDSNVELNLFSAWGIGNMVILKGEVANESFINTFIAKIIYPNLELFIAYCKRHYHSFQLHIYLLP